MSPRTAPTIERTDEYAALAPLFNDLAHSDTSGRRRLRTRLVTGYLPVAEHIAQRFRGRGQSTDDLTQVATLGLINAVDRFDPSRGTNFLAFAIPTITGELRRYFRDATWSVHMPRRLKELSTAVRDTTNTLGQRLGRAPRPTEIAEALGIPVEDVYEGLQAGDAYRSESLDTDDSTVTATVHDRVADLDRALETVENRERLRPALATLPDRQATVVMLRFFDDLTQSQIARRIGVSQMQVSRLLAESLRRLRAELT
jgi:RNA polymerase sigma-B factor